MDWFAVVMRFFVTGFLVWVGSSGLVGCSSWPLSSKWAMDDPDYSEKYSPAYGKDKPLRMLKQTADARFVDDKSGWYAGGAGSTSPGTGGAEVGGFAYLAPWLEGKLGLAALVGTGAEDGFIGANGGLRLQSPTRVAPFIGIGSFLGGNVYQVPGRDDGIDNDDDSSIDELGETKSEYSFLGAVYPEVGMHYWLTGRTRLTGSASYFITSDGRDSDFWFYGLSISFLTDGFKITPAKTEEASEPSESSCPPIAAERRD